MERSAEALPKSAHFTWKRASLLARLIVTASLLVWLFLHLDLTKTWSLLQAVDPAYILVAFVLTLMGIGMEAKRWQLLLRAIHIRLPLKEICVITFISNFFNYFLPSRMGGEAVRLYYVNKLSGRPAEVLLSILVDRCLGVVGLVSVPLLVISIHRPTGRFSWSIGLVYAAASAVLLLTIALGLVLSRRPAPPLPTKRNTRLHALLRSLRSSLRLYAEKKGVLLQALGITIVSHVLNITIYYNLGIAFGEGNRVLDYFYFVPVVALATVLPVSLGGVGVREWTFVSLFTELGMSRQRALSVALLNLLVKIAAGLIGAAFYLARGRPRHG